MFSKTAPRVVIIGAGIVGAAAAFFLSKAGAQVTVLEREEPSAGATGSSDGAVSVGTKRPGPLMGVAQRARVLYEKLAHNGVLSGLYHARPTFLLARGDLEMSIVGEHAEDLRRAGELCDTLDRPALLSIMPGLGEQVSGGAVVRGDGHAIGYEITHRLLSLSSASVARNTPAEALVVENGRVTGVRTPLGTMAADRVILAAGLGSRLFLENPDALLPRKGQMLVTDRVVPSGPALPGHIISAAYLTAKRSVQIGKPQISLVIDPLMTGQLLIGGSRESNNDDRRTDAETISTILREAIDLYPLVENCRVLKTFSGTRTAMIDGLPIVGESTSTAGLIVATGFEGDGICLGPMMGMVTSELALDRPPSLDLSAFSPARFQS